MIGHGGLPAVGVFELAMGTVLADLLEPQPLQDMDHFVRF